MEVRVLKDSVVNKIAAGEVVERPASVVRELVDNALDSGANDIAIRLEGGGRNLVEVRDNGCGMARDDALMCVERHATSKLRDETDLDEIGTLGFRGEALSSIASVAKVRILTRRSGDPLGTSVLIEGGKIRSVDAEPCRLGTTISVRRIFFNTPARRKFLRTPKTEEKRITAWLRGAVLAFPEVRFRLISDGKEQLNFPARDSVMSRAKLLHQGSFADVKCAREGYTLIGMVSHPGLAQFDSNSFTILLNGRVIKDSMLMRAIREGFESTLKSKEYPIGFLSLRVNPRLVDVNVHPQKSEVRFHNIGEVFSLVRDAVGDAVQEFRLPVRETAKFASMNKLSKSSLFEEMEAEVHSTAAHQSAFEFEGFGAHPEAQGLEVSMSSPEAEVVRNEDSAREGRRGEVVVNTAAGDASPKGDTSAMDNTQTRASERQFRFCDLKYIGQALECYLFCEKADELYVIDMHAAHERANYERIRRDYEKRAVFSQQMLTPITVELTSERMKSCLSQSEMLAQFGFELESFGGTTLLVRAAPSLLRPNMVSDCLKEVASLATEIEELEAEGASAAMSQMLDRVCARLACHASIRSGKTMRKEEVYALFAELDRAAFSGACPHGRPIIVNFSAADVERWFGRDR